MGNAAVRDCCRLSNNARALDHLLLFAVRSGGGGGLIHKLAGLSLGRMLACVASDVDDGVESGHEEDVQVQEKNGLNGWFNYMY